MLVYAPELKYLFTIGLTGIVTIANLFIPHDYFSTKSSLGEKLGFLGIIAAILLGVNSDKIVYNNGYFEKMNKLINKATQNIPGADNDKYHMVVKEKGVKIDIKNFLNSLKNMNEADLKTVDDSVVTLIKSFKKGILNKEKIREFTTKFAENVIKLNYIINNRKKLGIDNKTLNKVITILEINKNLIKGLNEYEKENLSNSNIVAYTLEQLAAKHKNPAAYAALDSVFRTITGSGLPNLSSTSVNNITPQAHM